MPGKSKIIVALSGGVDSAVAALMLLRRGYDVEGLHMTNWDDDDGYCTAAADHRDARLVCAELGIPLHHVNFAQQYREQVFAHFLAEYRAGRTPNPDVLCNREIKFGVFLDYALRLGGTKIATGHYARISGDGDNTRLLKGVDRGKDQSYFLHAVHRHALSQTLFPLGELCKAEVRDRATAAGLPVHEKKDSTGICFIGERPFREFLGAYLDAEPGPMVDADGRSVGEHQGLSYYTIGQRQGLGLGGQAETGSAPWFVAGKDRSRNELQVVQGRDHPALFSASLTTGPGHFIGGVPAALAQGDFECAVKLRYRQPDAGCRVRYGRGDALAVHFDQPQWAVAPGQFAVLYRGEECLGGAVIDQPCPARPAQGAPIAATA